MNDTRPSFLRRNPIFGWVLALGIVLTVFGGWAGLQYWRKAPPKKHAPVEVAKVEPQKVVLVEGGGSSMSVKPNDDDEEETTPPEPTEPDDDTPPVIGKADPELDQFVVKEQTDSTAPSTKRVGKLAAVKVTTVGVRPPLMVAKQLDTILDRKLAEAKIPVSPVATDAEFLRRASIDITGVIPSASKVRAFLQSKDPEKRAKLIDELLADSDYGDYAAHTWHDLLVKRDSDNNKTIKSQDLFVKWLASSFNANKPWNETVKSMLVAKGDQATVGEAFFILANAETGQPAPNKLVGTASALFLGNQLMCAECHIHPMTPEWTQQDFWGLAAFFGHTRAEREAGLKKNNTNAIAKITDEPVAAAAKGKGKMANGKATTQADGSIPIPDPRNDGKFVGSAKAKVLDGKPVSKADVTRATVADWMVSAKNPYFARAAANRLWAGFFATGFINPLDDIRPDSVASHPEALELLAEEFIASKFDLKHMIRVIARTEAYQRSSKTTKANEEDKELYSHMTMKVLSPRSMFRSLALATGNQVSVPTDPQPGDKPAKQDTNAGGLTFFDAREYDENPGEYTYGVPQLLRLMNSKLPPACDAFAKTASKLGSQEKVIEHLYVTALSRMPTPFEIQKMGAFVKQQGSAEKGYSAAMWVLLNSAEFVNNH